MNRRILKIFSLIVFFMIILTLTTKPVQAKTTYTITVDYSDFKLKVLKNGRVVKISDISYAKSNDKKMPAGTYTIKEKDDSFHLNGGKFYYNSKLYDSNGNKMHKGIHSPRYIKQKGVWKLEANQMKKRVTCGCIRVTTECAKYIYDNCPNGTKVKISE